MCATHIKSDLAHLEYMLTKIILLTNLFSLSGIQVINYIVSLYSEDGTEVSWPIAENLITTTFYFILFKNKINLFD